MTNKKNKPLSCVRRILIKMHCESCRKVSDLVHKSCEQCNSFCCENCMNEINKLDDDDKKLYKVLEYNNVVCNDCLEEDNPKITEGHTYTILSMLEYKELLRSNELNVSTELLDLLGMDKAYSLKELFDKFSVNKDGMYELSDELSKYFGTTRPLTKYELIDLLCNEIISDHSKGANTKA